MTSFVKNPSLARILLACLAAFLIATAAVTFFEFGSAPTDENLFTNPPSALFVRHDLPSAGPDMGLRAGDLIVEVNGFRIQGPDDISRLLKSVPSDSFITGFSYTPIGGGKGKFRVPRSAISDSSLVWLKSAVLVVGVEPAGASDRAGMKVGDIIVRINGQEFKEMYEADRILRRGQSGRATVYEVIRGSEKLNLQVVLARFGFPLALLILSLSGFVYLAVGSFIALRKPQLKAAILLGTGFLLIGYFLSIIVIRREVDPSFFASMRTLLMIPALFFGTALIWHSGHYFPKELPGMLARRWTRYVEYGLAAIASILSILALVTDRLMGQTGNIAVLAGVSVMFLYMIVVGFTFRKGRTPEYKRQCRALRIAGISMGVLSIASVVAQRVFRLEFLTGLLGIVFLLMPAAYLYTIGRYRLLDMNLRIRRNVQYTFLSILWGAVVGLVFATILFVLMSIHLNLPAVVLRGASVELNDLPPVRGESNPLERFAVIAIAAGVWFLLWKIRRWGQDIIDARYFRTQYDYRKAARELAETLSTKLSMVDLGGGLVEKIVSLMNLKRGAVFFFREGSVCCCREVIGIDATVWAGFCLNDEKALAKATASFEGGFSTDLLPPGLKEQFREQDLRYIVPIRSKDQLIGLLALGEKLSEAPYSNEDMEFLTAAASQSSVSIENAFLYEELAEKERMKLELEIARRIQMASLPQKTPNVPGLDVSGKSVPAMEVGGDFFDYLNGQANQLTVVVGDVSGKGTSAALYMSKVQGILRSLHDFALSPAELFVRTNRLLAGDMERNSFITALAGAFDTNNRQLVLTRAGHLPLYRFIAHTGLAEIVTPKGLGLGLENEGLFSTELEERKLQYDPGDVLVFVTDGIIEARNEKKEEFGEERLLKILGSQASSGADVMRDRILEEVRTFAGQAAPHDDQTVVVVKAL
jgi:serine phosphatase RsbU (regulator of sigma subunit)